MMTVPNLNPSRFFTDNLTSDGIFKRRGAEVSRIKPIGEGKFWGEEMVEETSKSPGISAYQAENVAKKNFGKELEAEIKRLMDTGHVSRKTVVQIALANSAKGPSVDPTVLFNGNMHDVLYYRLGEKLRAHLTIPDPRDIIPDTKIGAGETAIVVIRDRLEVLRYSKAIIAAFEEVLDFDPLRNHNHPYPTLWLEDDLYKEELAQIVQELRRLNSYLIDQGLETKASASATKLGEYFDELFSSYATALGKGAAGLTIATAAALLYQAGIGKEIIDNIWMHWKH